MMSSASLQLQASVELELRKRRQTEAAIAPADWDNWLATLFPDYVTAPFTDRHVTFWEWIEAIEAGVRPSALAAIWPRGGTKSTSAELACVRVGVNESRNYIWYACETQEQADKHVETIAIMLEAPEVEKYHYSLSQRKLSKFGRPRGWRRNRVWTESGLTVDAIGLDTAARGARVEENRPGLIILDDIDSKHDSPAAIRKKKEIIANSLLPAGSPDVAVLFVQNTIHPNSIATQLVEGTADFLHDRVVSGPFPAVEGLTYEQREGKFYITGGTATWEGQGLETCQDQINTWGISAFLQEAQQEVEAPPGGIWNHIEFRHCDHDEVPDLVRGCVWVDPAVTSTDQSDSMGIQADGKDENGIIYRFYSWEQQTSPEDALKRAILKALELDFDTVGVETDQGGDTWQSVYRRAWDQLLDDDDYPEVHRAVKATKDTEAQPATRMPKFASAKAGAGHGSKVHRNGQMLVDYEHGRVVHVRGTHNVLERALKRFAGTKPLDLVDASYWSWYDLRHGSKYGGIHV